MEGGIKRKVVGFILIIGLVMTCCQKKSAKGYFNQAETEFNKGDFDKAIKYCREGLNLEPRSTPLRRRLISTPTT